MTKKSFLVYFDWEAPLQELSNEELGELFRAMFIYAKYGELIDFEHRSLKLVFGFVKSAIDRDKASYEERCRKNAENGAKGGKKAKGYSFEREQNCCPELCFKYKL